MHEVVEVVNVRVVDEVDVRVTCIQTVSISPKRIEANDVSTSPAVYSNVHCVALSGSLLGGTCTNDAVL